MNNKCSSCGFINFATAEQCKKCEAVLPPIDQTQAAASVHYSAAELQRHATPPTQPNMGRQVLAAFAYVLLGIFLLSMFFSGWKSLLPSLGSGKVKWIEYHPAEVDMTVMMPNEPKIVGPEITPMLSGTVTTYAFVSGVPGQGMAVLDITEYSGNSDWSNNPETLAVAMEQELNAFVQRTDAFLISKNWVAFSGTRALEFITQPPGKGQVYGKLFTSHHRFFVLTIAAKEGSELFEGKDKFLNPVMPNNNTY